MPVSDELLLKLIYQEENQRLLSEASAQLDKMTDAEKELVKQNAALKDSSEQVTSGFSKMQAGIVTLNAVIGVAKEGIEIFKKGWDFAKEGAAIDRIQTQFKNIATSINTDSERLLAGLNKAAHGTVDDEQLMQTATRAMALGIANNSDDLIKLMEVARASSVAFGGDTSAAFERISSAVENLAPRSLKQSGIIINLDKAYKDYAASLDKTSELLTDEEKRQALLNQVLEKGADLVKRIGAQGEDTATKIAQMETRVQDLGDSLKVALLPYTEKIVDSFSAWAEQITPITSREEALRRLVMISAQTWGAESDQVKAASKALQEYLIVSQKFDAFTDKMRSMKPIETAAPIDTRAATDLSKLTPEKQAEATKAYTDYQDKLVSIEDKGSADREKIVQEAVDALNKLESDSSQKRADIIEKFAIDEANRLSDMHDKRIEIISNYAEAEQKITDAQNKDRLKLAQSYGIEVQRMEEDHQRSMARLQEDHGRKMSRLADSRDALGLQDEQENYEIERRRAEEDYQTGAQRKSEDYARQLADQNASFEAQRQAAKENEQKQLTALDEQFAKQDTRYKAAYDKQLKDFDKAAQDQKFAIQTAEYKKLQDLSTSLADERTKTNAAWTQWRNEHDIFFAGERKAYDAYLKYTHDQLQAYIKGGGTIPTTEPITGGVPTTGSPFRAMGGRVDPFGSYIVGERGPERLRMGRQGGYIFPGMGALSIGKVEINVPNTNATTEQIKEAVYAGITEVMQAAMR